MTSFVTFVIVTRCDCKYYIVYLTKAIKKKLSQLTNESAGHFADQLTESK